MEHLAALIRALAALALLAPLLAAPTALAQLPQPSLSVMLTETSLTMGAANTTTFTGSVSYADAAPSTGTITLAVAAPEGWTLTVEPSTSFTLNSGQSADFELTLVAPAEGAGAPTGDASVTATSTDQVGRSATASATLALALLAPPPAPIPWYAQPWGILLLVGLPLALLGIGLLARRERQLHKAAWEKAQWLDRETGIAISVNGGPKEYGHKREVMYRVTVTNVSDRPRVALLDVVKITNGWRAATQVTKLPLSKGETQGVTLVVTPDAVITPGDRATVVLRAKPEEAQEKDERVTIEVVAPKHGVPTDPHYRIVSVHREGANNAGIKAK